MTIRLTKIPGVCTWSGSMVPGWRNSSSTSTMAVRAAWAMMGAEISLAQPVLKIAGGVRPMGTDEGVIGAEGVLQKIFAPVYVLVFLSFGNLSAHTSGGVKGPDAGTRSPDPL